MFATLSHYFSSRDVALDISFLCSIVLAWFVPQFGDGILSTAERFGTQLAQRKRLAVLTIALVAILIRLSLLWIVPVPVPHTHDEFSYLLAADTFAHGRLTNPPHPMWVFFDTIHVNQNPTYMSKYPPAQGAALALGQLVQSPWVGVVLSVSGMCAAVLWMLQGWLPPPWALLGAVLMLFRLGVFSYWMNSYWGGAVAAIGGALVVGALPRILHFRRTRDAVTLGLGVAVLMNSRPAEGFILCVPVASVLAVWLWRARNPSTNVNLPRFMLAICIPIVASVIFMGYYNSRGTGSFFLMPYMVNERTYVSTPTLLWQSVRPPIHFANPQFNAFYNGWMHNLWLQGQSDTLKHAARHISSVITKFVYFYMWPELCVPLVTLLWVLGDRRVRFLIIQTAFCFLAFLSVAWFQPHYAAPLAATFFALLVQAIRHLRRWKYGGRPVGIGLTRVIVLFAVILVPFHPHAATLGHIVPSGIEYRAQFETQLDGTPGNHLVIVRYSPEHDVLVEWVYNRADIDRAKIVWAREIPGVDLSPLLNYFSGRNIWLVEPDASPPRITHYLENPCLL